MEGIKAALTAWQLHPVVDHFAVGILAVALLADLLASILWTRVWFQYMALTLMLGGALAALLSWFTGGLEANRIWEALHGPAKELFKSHAQLGEILIYVFGGLALWRILIQAISYFTPSRPAYLLFTMAAVGALFWQGHLGGELVYKYGVGTALMPGPSSPSALPSFSMPAIPTALPTVFVPVPETTTTPAATPLPTQSSVPSPAPTAVL